MLANILAMATRIGCPSHGKEVIKLPLDRKTSQNYPRLRKSQTTLSSVGKSGKARR